MSSTIREGKAEILFPSPDKVFYNPVQEFNRDLSIAAIRTWSALIAEEVGDASLPRYRRAHLPCTTDGKLKFKVLEALSATGLRSIRYAKEIPNIEQIYANDLSAEAIEQIRANIKHNELSEELIFPSHRDAVALMYEHRDHDKRFHVIDLDPYGSASIFLDSAVQAIADGGLLCITCTDLMVLAGGQYVEACFAKYGGSAIKADHCHEFALRLVLHALQTSASRYKRHIVPVLSCSIDFYVRIFVRVYTSPKMVKESASNTGIVYQCMQCKSFYLQPFGKMKKQQDSAVSFAVANGPPLDQNCPQCGQSSCQVGGPIWLGRLHDPTFLQKMLNHVGDSSGTAGEGEEKANYGTQQRMKGMLTVISEELLDSPLYYVIPSLARVLHCTVPSIVQFCSALLNAGFEVSLTHAHPNAIKTNAPVQAIWDLMRCWVKSNPIKDQPKEGCAGHLLSKDIATEFDFTTIHPRSNPESRKVKLVRFQENPTKNWGPGTKPSSKKRKNDN